MLLAGDVGGTKTRLGLFKAIGRRPPPVATREYATLDFPSLVAMIEDFRKAVGSGSSIDAACFGKLTRLPSCSPSAAYHS